ncbi:hypothetical protein ACLKA7_003581 [Drosophila subpalustris]
MVGESSWLGQANASCHNGNATKRNWWTESELESKSKSELELESWLNCMHKMRKHRTRAIQRNEQMSK